MLCYKLRSNLQSKYLQIKLLNNYQNKYFSMEDTLSRLTQFREIMKRKGYDSYIVPHTDSHDNEYIAEQDERIKFISNFGGSNGICLITHNEALLWTDGRYYLQAEKELYQGWKMMKMEKKEIDLKTYIKQNLPINSKIGVDFNFYSISSFNQLSDFLKEFQIVSDEPNSVDELWKDKPKVSSDLVLIHKLEYAGETCSQKFKRVRQRIPFSKLQGKTDVAILLTRLDDIAWLTNLRGNDIEYNPLFFSYGILYLEKETEYLHLYANKQKFNTEEIREHLKQNNITLFEYSEIYNHLKERSLPSFKFIIDQESCNQYINSIATSNTNLDIKYFENDFIEDTKGIKTLREIQGFRDCHLRDGAAIIRYLAWLENELLNNNRTDITEYSGTLQLLAFRKEQELFMGESFNTISSSGANAAIIHYKPNKTSSNPIEKDKIYLLDSGGQYLDGTTDTTRTVHFGTPSAYEKEMYTRVLLGNLSLERSIFLKRWNLNGGRLDSIARQFLWHCKSDYLHGTGHGVGYFLNVHEGPHGIGGYPNNPTLENGMVVTNEPGFYLKDQFGIRIENLLVTLDEGPDHLKFENVTCVPYEINLFDHKLISEDFKEFINNFHSQLYNKLQPLLTKQGDNIALEYLKRKTVKI